MTGHGQDGSARAGPSRVIKLSHCSEVCVSRRAAYSTERYHYLKTQAEEERSIAAEKKKKPDEQRLIERELAEEAQEDSVLKVDGNGPNLLEKSTFPARPVYLAFAVQKLPSDNRIFHCSGNSCLKDQTSLHAAAAFALGRRNEITVFMKEKNLSCCHRGVCRFLSQRGSRITSPPHPKFHSRIAPPPTSHPPSTLNSDIQIGQGSRLERSKGDWAERLPGTGRDRDARASSG
ncbi:hypothetical protein AB1E19_001141 [Capra hircus]